MNQCWKMYVMSRRYLAGIFYDTILEGNKLSNHQENERKRNGKELELTTNKEERNVTKLRWQRRQFCSHVNRRQRQEAVKH